MAKPESPQHGVTFDLAALERELQQEASYLREGQTARTLVRTHDLRVLLIVLKKGRRMSEHRANATASVQTMSGQLRLALPDRAVSLSAGQLLVLGHGLRHDVEAEEDSALLLTLSWHDQP